MHRSQQAWGRSLRSCIMITTTTTKQKSRGRKSTLHDECCLVLHDQLWIDLAVLRRCSVAVWFGMTSKIKPEEDPKHGFRLSLYSQPSWWAKGELGREDVLYCWFWSCVVPQMAELLSLCWPLLNSLGALGSSLQFGSRCQASGFGTSWCFPVEAIGWSKSQWGI